MGYIVTRQLRWPDGAHTVEVTRGGHDGCSPDALCARYGECVEYQDPREAVFAAFGVFAAWEADLQGEPVEFGFGSTLGGSAYLETEEGLSEDLARAAVGWAWRAWEAVPKCDWCGRPLPERGQWGAGDYGTGDEAFCCEQCAEAFCCEQCAEGWEYEHDAA